MKRKIEIDGSVTIECQLHVSRRGKGNKIDKKPPVVPEERGRIPRISRLMALAIHFDDLIREGAVEDYADLARLGSVTRARVTQVMGLLNLAPDIQEEILFLERIFKEQDAVAERMVRTVVEEADWGRQRVLWGDLQQHGRVSRGSAITQ